MTGRRPLWRIFAAPALIAILSLAGLIWALLVEGGLDVVAGLAAGASLAAVAWALLRRNREESRRDGRERTHGS